MRQPIRSNFVEPSLTRSALGTCVGLHVCYVGFDFNFRRSFNERAEKGWKFESAGRGRGRDDRLRPCVEADQGFVYSVVS